MSSKFSTRINNEKNFHDTRFSLDQKKSKIYKYGLYKWYEDYFQLIKKTRGKTLEIGAGLESCFLESKSLKNKIIQGELKVTSIDISEIAVKNCQNLTFEGLNFMIEDAHTLKNIEIEKLDNIVGRGIVHHLEIDLFIKNLTRNSKKQLTYIFAEPMRGPFYIRFYRFLTPKIRTIDEHPLTIYDLNKFKLSFKGKQRRKYYGFLTLLVSFFGFKSKTLENIDEFILNKLNLGRFLAWAVIIHNIE